MSKVGKVSKGKDMRRIGSEGRRSRMEGLALCWLYKRQPAEAMFQVATVIDGASSARPANAGWRRSLLHLGGISSARSTALEAGRRIHKKPGRVVHSADVVNPGWTFRIEGIPVTRGVRYMRLVEPFLSRVSHLCGGSA